MSLLPLAVFLSLSVLTAGQQCDNANLGLYLGLCMRCGSPGLDDFCIKRYGTCGSYAIGSGNSIYGNLGGGNGLPPYGYLSGGTPPPTCTALIDAASRIPNVNGITGTIPAYLPSGDYGTSMPRVYFNPSVLSQLNVLYPLHNCLENNAPYFRTAWNYGSGYSRIDSFFYNDNGNSTWSYQCYCDFCNACQSCTNG